MSAWRALVVEHDRAAPAGLIEEWLRARGGEVHVLPIDAQNDEVEVRDYEAIVSLGSEHPVYHPSLPWIQRELRLLEQATAGGVPILGVCFGCQILARALGGEVFAAAREEIGWLPIGTRVPAVLPEGPWFQWHFDTFTPPAGARVLAENGVGPQAFEIGASLGLQFHPEVTPAIIDRWIRDYRHELDEHGVAPEALLEETRRRADSTRAATWRLLDRWLDRASGGKV